MKRLNYRILAPVFLALLIAGCSKVSRSPDDSQITSAIQAKLYQNPDLKPLAISVASNEGVVTLSGAVNAPLEKLAVEDLARQTPGVKQVVDQLTVAQAAATPEAGPTAPPAQASAQTAAIQKHARRRNERRRRVAENRDPAQADQAPAEAAQAPADSASAPPAAPAAAQPAPAPPPPVVIPAGTNVSVRLVDPISSETAHQGQTFAATLATPLTSGDRVVIPQGADAKIQVVAVQSAGHYKGQSELKLTLASISYQGADYPVQTGYFEKQGASRTKNSAEKIGGGAALGALLGAVIGRGKGAGIGAAVGGAAGTVAQTATHGQQVTLPSETRLNFVLKAPISVNVSGE